jgi:hypothetical protein
MKDIIHRIEQILLLIVAPRLREMIIVILSSISFFIITIIFIDLLFIGPLAYLIPT